MSITQKAVFETSDNKQHETLEAAEAHQSLLDNAEVVETVADSFANITTAPGAKAVGLVGRTRVFNKNVASAVVSFLIAKGALSAEDLIEFEAIEASEELQARLDKFEADEAEKAAEAKAKKEAKDAEKGVETPTADADVEADVFE